MVYFSTPDIHYLKVLSKVFDGISDALLHQMLKEGKVLHLETGIQAHVKDKILHPFFTTKPTGQGTCLGLSLSYDIVKAHGGELNVETNEGRGSAFTILLPI